MLHDKVVSLTKRLEYITHRYGKRVEFKEKIQMMWDNTLVLESKLFSRLDIQPDELSTCMSDQKKTNYFQAGSTT